MTRDEAILAAAVALSQSGEYATMTRGSIADAAGMAPSNVSNYGRTGYYNRTFVSVGVMDRIRSHVMEWAVTNGDLALLRQGLAMRHPAALDAPEQLRMAALAGA